MSIRLNLASIDTTIASYDKVIADYTAREDSLRKAQSSAGSWQGSAANSWQARMDIIASQVLSPTLAEITKVRGALVDLKVRARSLRQEAESLGAILGGGGDSNGTHLVLDDTFDVQVSQAAMRVKQALIAQKNTWLTLEDAAKSLELGGVVVDGAPHAKISQDTGRIEAFEAAYTSYRQGVAELGQSLTSLLSHLNPDADDATECSVALGFAAYFASGGMKMLLGLKRLGCAFGADPVNMATGNYVYKTEELQMFGACPLSFVRTYNSCEKERSVLGLGWHHGFEMRVDDLGGVIDLVTSEGGLKTFYAEKDAKRFVTKTEQEEVIEKSEEGYCYFDSSRTTHVFDKTGRYVSLSTQTGHTKTLIYEKDKLVLVESDTDQKLFFSYEGAYLAEVKDHTGRKILFEYEKELLTGFVNECGYAYCYAYDPNGNLTRITNPKKIDVLTQAFDENGRILTQQLIEREEVVFQYDDDAHTITLIDEEGNKTTYASDKLFRTTQIRDIRGSEYFTYNERGLRTERIDRTGEKVKFSYDDTGKITSMIDPLGAPTRYIYTKEGLVSQVVSSGVCVLSATYNSQGQPISFSDALGAKTELSYNKKGKLCKTTSPEGNTMGLEYDNKGNVISIKDAEGGVLSYAYDTLGRRTEVKDLAGNTVSYCYDAASRIIEEKRLDGKTRNYTYDRCGNLTSVSDFDEALWSFEYTKAHDIACAKDPEGHTTFFTYDKKGRTVSRGNALGETTTYAYDAFDNLVKITSPTKETISFEYDKMDRQIAITDATGKKTFFEYDKRGRRVAKRLQNGYEIRVVYDNFDRPLCIHDADKVLAEYTWDSASRLIATKDIQGNEQRYTWDKDGKLISTTDATDVEVVLSYDKAGRLTDFTRRFKDQIHKTSCTRDVLGNITSVMDPLGSVKRYTYDKVGHLTSLIDEEGDTTNITYDVLGKITDIMYPDGTKRRTGYDKAGMVSIIKDDTSSLLFKYDDAYRVRSITDEAGNTMRYEWDGAGRIVSKAFPDDTNEHYCYDKAGRLVQIEGFGAKTAYEYDEDSRLICKHLGDFLEERYSWTAEGNLLSSAVYAHQKKLFVKNFSYGETGLLQAENFVANNKKSEITYTYDKAGRLSEVIRDGNTTRYVYDAFGNRIQKLSQDGTVSYIYDADDRLVEKTDKSGTYSYRYDRQGRLVGIDKHKESLSSFSYDGQGRLVSANTSHGEVFYSYDVTHTRKERATQEGSTCYMIDWLKPHSKIVAQERNGIYQRYLRDTSLSAVSEGDSVSYGICDTLGTPTHLFNGEADVVAQAAFDEFGEILGQSESTSIPFGFTGYITDEMTGLFYAEAREYSPGEGRFISQDVVPGTPFMPQSLNRYAYCASNPLSFVDRDGRQARSSGLLSEQNELWEGPIFGINDVDRTESSNTWSYDGVTKYEEDFMHYGGGAIVFNEVNREITEISVNLPWLSLGPPDSFFSIEGTTSLNIGISKGWISELGVSFSVQAEESIVHTFGYGGGPQGLYYFSESGITLPYMEGFGVGKNSGVRHDSSWDDLFNGLFGNVFGWAFAPAGNPQESTAPQKLPSVGDPLRFPWPFGSKQLSQLLERHSLTQFSALFCSDLTR